MIWLTWRQFRVQVLVGLGALMLLAIYLLVLGNQIHGAYDDTLTRCAGRDSCSSQLGTFADKYSLQLDLFGYLLLAVPGAIGIFWGAPLITRELESGTHRLAWNQSVTRRQWLAAKLGLGGLLGVVVAGLFSLVLTWASGPVDAVLNNRFEPVLFSSRNIAPLGYAAFAFVLGTTLGLFIRRTVPTMGVTLVALVVLQIVMPTVVRPHYVTPVRTSVPLTAELVSRLTKIGTYGEIGGLRVPGGPWVVKTSPMLDSAGREVGHTEWFQDCMNNHSMADLPTCLAEGNIHVDVSEQPADRYWTFQRYETGIFAVLAALVAGLCFWRIRGRLT
ncbi:ABC transporter permease subunit [Streptomyces atratus]|uniref:ABC transporter permease subunit n=1 Tax=Streptomyces atratus TaxID=1893 RepID=UPI00225BD5A4|nr:ABC transporter permease subunit [Streptomyces atratus]MCX5343577.1 ABC transporter permease subunit [Streptomyces atratus]